MRKIMLISVSLAVVFMWIFSFLCGVVVGERNNSKIVYLDLDETKIIENEESTKYPFLQKELSDYICTLSEELKIDSDLVVAILMVENPEFNYNAINRNENGTTDIGLFQLNDKYIWQTFVPNYWKIDIEFNPYNWKHSSFLALHHIEFLSHKLKVQNEVIMAYNCGIGAVMNNTIPESTKIYLAKVKNNLLLLNNMN